MLRAQLLPDLLVSDSAGRPVANVEVKNRQELTPDVATELRRNLLVHGAPGEAPYFLLLSQDDGYLWPSTSAAEAPPGRQFPWVL